MLEIAVDVDAELMVAVGRGDRQAFATLFDRHQASVVRFARRFVGGDAGRAEELAQDIFVKLFRSAGAYRTRARFKTFLFRVAANHCLNEVRRAEHRTRPSEAGVDGEEGATLWDTGSWSPDQVVAGRQLEATVQQALGELPERERAAFVMCRFEGMAYREIAAALEASEPAVKSLIHRATLAVARRVDQAAAGSAPARSRG